MCCYSQFPIIAEEAAGVIGNYYCHTFHFKKAAEEICQYVVIAALVIVLLHPELFANNWRPASGHWKTVSVNTIFFLGKS
jgi:hypothetical protein